MLRKVERALLFLILLFLPTQLGRHFWPDFSYVYSLKIDYLSPTLFFWDILVVLLLLVWIIKKPKINKLAFNLGLFFLLTQFTSLLNAQNVEASLVRFEQFLIASLFGVYLASLDFKKLWPAIYLPLLLGVLGEAIIAILQFFKGSTLGLWVLGERSFTISTPAIAKFDFMGMQFLRPYGTFPHPNVLGGYVLVLSILIIRKPIFLILAALAVFLTMSRTAILGSLAAAAFLLKKKWLILAGFLFLLVSPILFIRFTSLFNFDSLAYLRREELAASAWQMFLNYPFFGVGLNNFISSSAFTLTAGPNRFLQPVHNIFLLALSETGLTGFLGLIGLIGYSMLKSKLYLVWTAVIFLGMFDHYFLTLPQGYRLFFLLWGLSLSRARIIL